MVLPLFKKAVKTVKTVIKSLAIDFMTVFYRFLKQNEKIWKTLYNIVLVGVIFLRLMHLEEGRDEFS
ncbi:hypothetical protein C824_002091 [Schaedlerella arabinosiphila]|nr:hypothetical protein C824_002091 [Schaedlerella arabinosiphila]